MSVRFERSQSSLAHMRADAIQSTQLVDSHLNRKSRKCTRPSSPQTTSTQKNLTLFPKSSEPLGVEGSFH